MRKKHPPRCFSCYQPINNLAHAKKRASEVEQNYSDNSDKDIYFHDACAHKLFGTTTTPIVGEPFLDLESISHDYVTERLAVPGVQKKLSVRFAESAGEHKRLTISGFLDGTHILKPPSAEYPFMPEVEDFTMKTAGICGINSAVHSLVPFSDGSKGYICKRFDRHPNEKLIRAGSRSKVRAVKKLSVEDFCQLSDQMTRDKYKYSSEKMGRLISQYSTFPGSDHLILFEMLLHSFLIGNADMHLKNFSLIIAPNGIVKFSPAYDLLSTRLLIPAHMDSEELAIPLNGKKHQIRKKDWLLFAKSLQLSEKIVQRSLHNFIDCYSDIKILCGISFMPEEMKTKFYALIEDRFSRIE